MEPIAKLIEKLPAGGTLHLPTGEFEGPFPLNKPCTLIGRNTTLWSKKGPVVSVNTNGIALENIRMEVTGNFIQSQDRICISCNDKKPTIEGIEVSGQVSGFAGEEGFWDFPRKISLETFPANKTCTYYAEVYVPVPCTLQHKMKGVTISPDSLAIGKNKLTIEIDGLQSDTYLYGDILLFSSFIRRISLWGVASSTAPDYVDKKTVYTCEKPSKEQSKARSTPAIISVPSPTPSPSPPPPAQTLSPTVKVLQRGERLAVGHVLGETFTVSLGYSSMLEDMDIETYGFLLDKTGRATEDWQLVFFGNSTSDGVKYNTDRSIQITLPAIKNEIEKIVIAYAIYGDDSKHNFSKVDKPVIELSAHAKEPICFFPEDLMVEKTIVALEIYKHQGTWRLKTVGHGYQEGLRRLCESFGLTIE